MAVLSNKFDILRGWPNASAVAEDFIIGGTSSHPHKQGQWVTLDTTVTDGTMTTLDNLNNTDSSVGVSCYLIIEGRDDYSSQFANRVTCLIGGGYMVRLPQTGVDSDGQNYNILSVAASNFAPGQPVKVADGVLAPVPAIDVDAADEGLARASIVGRVMAVNAADNTIDIFVS